MAEERLQKILAQAGLGSRRACEELIVQGRVTVNGETVRELGAKADPESDEVRLDGERVREERKRYFLLDKPRGYVCSNSDEQGRKRAIDLLKHVSQRTYKVGRLDIDSEGLIVVTNDGEFANLLTHPRYGVPKTYLAEVEGEVTAEGCAELRRGLHLSYGKASIDSLRVVKSGKERSLLEITLKEGRNRQIRRMLAALGHEVKRLRRVRVGPVSDEGLKAGKYRRLSKQEIDALRRVATSGRA